MARLLALNIALFYLLGGLLLSGCAADGGFVSRNRLVEAINYTYDVDETRHVGCCDEDYRILSPVSTWYRPNTQAESVEIGWVWHKQHPERSALDVRLVTANGYRRLKKVVIEINGEASAHRPETRMTLWEGNDIFRAPCLPPACFSDTFLFRSTRLFPISTEMARQIAGSDRVRVTVFDEGGRPIYGYLPPRHDIAAQRRHLLFWLRAVESQLKKEADSFEEFS